MTDEELDQLVEAIARPEIRKLLDSLPLEVGQVLSKANANRTGGGWLTNRVYHVAGDALERAIALRCEAELNVHRRLNLPLGESRRHRLLSVLSEMIDGAFKSLEIHAYVRNEASVGGAPSRTEARQRLAGVAHDRAAALAAELSLPRLDAGQSITVNMNAPNHGVVAGKIDSLHVSNAEAGRELQAALREILEAVESLGEHAEEARELLAELMQQAETKPQPVLVRTGAARLRDLLSVAGAAARLIELAEKLPHLIHPASSSGWIPS